MGIVISIARLMAKEIKRSNPEETIGVDRMAAVLANKFNTWVIVLLTLALSFVFHQFFGSLLVMAAFVVLRLQTGGRHMPNLDVCVLFSVSLFLVIPFIELPYKFTLIFNTATMFILFFNATASAGKANRSLYFRRQIISFMLVLLAYFPGLDIIVLSCFSQAVLLLGKEVK